MRISGKLFSVDTQGDSVIRFYSKCKADLKIGIGQREPAKDRRELERQVCEHMDGVKANPEKVAAFFSKTECEICSRLATRYASRLIYTPRRQRV